MNTIKSFRIGKSMTQAELAAYCGVHQTAVSQWEKGRTLPDMQTLVKLAELFEVSIEALVGREDSPKKRRMIPILGYVRAGVPMEAIEDILGYEEIPESMAASGEYFALSVRGDSMLPRICPGDVVIVKKQSYIENGEVAVVLVNGMDATVKKVIKKGTSLTLVPFNSDYDPMIFSAEEVNSLPVSIIGKVVELRGKF